MPDMDLVPFALHPYRWYYMRFIHLLECIRNPREFNEVSRMGGDDAYVYTMLHVDAIASFLSFLELFPAYFEHAYRMQGIQGALNRYTVQEVEGFFRGLGTESWPLVHQCMGYGYVKGDPELDQTLVEHAKSVCAFLHHCGHFYLSHKPLLNAFKHGMRIATLDEKPPRCAFVCLSDRKREDKGLLIIWEEERTERMKEAFDFLVSLLAGLLDRFCLARDIGENETREYVLQGYAPPAFPAI